MAGDRPGGDEPSSADLSERLERLGARLDRFDPGQLRNPSGQSESGGDASAIGQAFRVSTELVAGIIAGGIVGYLLDRFAGTSPFGLIVLLMLGFCAGILNVLRWAAARQRARDGTGPPGAGAGADGGKRGT